MHLRTRPHAVLTDTGREWHSYPHTTSIPLSEIRCLHSFTSDTASQDRAFSPHFFLATFLVGKEETFVEQRRKNKLAAFRDRRNFELHVRLPNVQASQTIGGNGILCRPERRSVVCNVSRYLGTLSSLFNTHRKRGLCPSTSTPFPSKHTQAIPSFPSFCLASSPQPSAFGPPTRERAVSEPCFPFAFCSPSCLIRKDGSILLLVRFWSTLVMRLWAIPLAIY